MKNTILLLLFTALSVNSFGQVYARLRINGVNYADNSTVDLDCGTLNLTISAVGVDQAGNYYGTKCQNGWAYPSGWQLISEDGCDKVVQTNSLGEGTLTATYVIYCGFTCIATPTVTVHFKRRTPPTPIITSSNPILICSGGNENISAGFVPYVYSYTWSSEGGASVSSTGFSTANVTASSSGKVKLRADADPATGCPNSGWAETNVHFGPPVISNPIQWLFDSYSNMYQCSNIITPFFYTTCTWTLVSGSATLVPNNNDCYVTTTGGAMVSITASNTCGTSNTVYYDIPAAEGYRMMAYPNPTKNVLTLELKSEDVSSVDIYSQSSAERVKSVSVKDFVKDNASKEGPKVELNVGDLPRGIYYLHINPKVDSKQKVQIVQVRLE